MRACGLCLLLLACGGEDDERDSLESAGPVGTEQPEPWDEQGDPSTPWTEEAPAEADPWFESSVAGGVWSTDDGSYRVDSADDLMLSANLDDGGDLDLFVIGTVDGPGTYSVTAVQYYRYDDPISAIGTWSADDDPGSMTLRILEISDGLMQAEWSGSVVMEGFESTGSAATWSVGSGWVQDWAGSGLDDAGEQGSGSP